MQEVRSARFPWLKINKNRHAEIVVQLTSLLTVTQSLTSVQYWVLRVELTFPQPEILSVSPFVRHYVMSKVEQLPIYN